MATKSKPSMDYLTDISNILKEQGSNELKPNEFTSEMFKVEYEKLNGKTTTCSIHSRLKRMEDRGKITKRKISMKGSSTNAYKLIK
tara:strand:- start:434 stop:691 length:258 start_codon:yes stop_codon:yes gene_type:complete